MIEIILFLVVIIIIIYYSNNSQCNYKKEPFQHQKYNDPVMAKIVKVIDGNEVDAIFKNPETNIIHKYKIRLEGIKAPKVPELISTNKDEVIKAYKAKQVVEQMILNKHVYLKINGHDVYNRLLGTIYINNINLNKYLIANNYAKKYIKKNYREAYTMSNSNGGRDDGDGGRGDGKCNLDIDNLYILDRNKEYSKYINKLVDNNDNINYTDDEIKIMKNKHQFYNINNNDNISNLVLGECKNSYGYGYGAEGIDVNVSIEGGYDVGGGSYYGTNSNVSGGYNSDIKPSIKGAGTYSKGALETIGSVGFAGLINNDDPVRASTCADECITNGYLTDYYYDLEGNNIKSTLKEYVNSDENNICEPVTYNKAGSGSNMIIPDLYNINKNLTDAYDVNWSDVVNPLTIY
jgi:endonuclease YncB( thermonuclease family)